MQRQSGFLGVLAHLRPHAQMGPIIVNVDIRPQELAHFVNAQAGIEQERVVQSVFLSVPDELIKRGLLELVTQP